MTVREEARKALAMYLLAEAPIISTLEDLLDAYVEAVIRESTRNVELVIKPL